MKAKFEKISYDDFSSLKIQDLRMPRFNAPWHFHPDYELTLILESSGTRYVGNSIEPFEKGDLVLIGSNLHHFWENNRKYPGKKPAPRAIVMHFSFGFAGKDFFDMPLMAPIRQMLDASAAGLKFQKATVSALSRRILRLPNLKGSDKVLAFIEILNILSKEADSIMLNNMEFLPEFNHYSAHRMNKIYRYVSEKYPEKISLKTVAALSSMSVNGFSRYFSEKSGISFNKFLNRVRINHACRSLQDTDLSIAQVSFDCGFTSISNFNKRFKAIKKMTPREFRSLFKKD